MKDLDSLLRDASFNGNNNEVLALLNKGADVHSKNQLSGRAALHFACRKGNSTTALILLDIGADINAKDNFGFSALHRACSGNHLATANLLIERGATPDLNHQTDVNGWTALHFACMDGHRELAEFLIRNGASIYINDWKGKGHSPIHFQPMWREELIKLYKEVNTAHLSG